MPLSNLISIEFTAAELAQIDDAIGVLEKVYAGKTVQLTPEESQQYGKLGNETENWTQMILADSGSAPAGIVPVFINKPEWLKDDTVRKQLAERSTRLLNLSQQMEDTNRLVGFDIYQTCLSVYNNTKFLNTQDFPGAKALYEKWSIQFPGRPKKAGSTDTP